MIEASVIVAGLAGLIAVLATAWSGFAWLRARLAVVPRKGGVSDDADWEI